MNLTDSHYLAKMSLVSTTLVFLQGNASQIKQMVAFMNTHYLYLLLEVKGCASEHYLLLEVKGFAQNIFMNTE